MGTVPGSPPRAFSEHDRELHGGFSNVSPSTSPSFAYRQPIRRNNGYQSFGDYLGSSATPGKAKPVSMYSQYSQVPPLPHHPQPHFYTAPNIDIGFPQSRSDSKKRGNGYYCGFDSLCSVGNDAALVNVLLVGHEKGLIIHKIEKDKLQSLGRLEGLRGAVIGAKVLPSNSRHDYFLPLRPLVAVVVHGPAASTRSPEQSRPASSNAHDEEFDPSGSMLQALSSADDALPNLATHYQTTVEVYSLKARQHVATLFKSPLVKIDVSSSGQFSSSPPPVGNLSIRANGKFVIVASGTSGEVFIFEPTSSAVHQSTGTFRCLGKVWTDILSRKTRSMSTSSTSSEADLTNDSTTAQRLTPDNPILALSSRWLAIVPPKPSIRSTLHGTVDLPLSSQKPHGITSHTASSQPQPTCELDTPERESLLNRVARDVTQEVIKGARWVGDQGMQAWKSYWSKPPEYSSQNTHPPMVQQAQQNFPPTHAQDEPRPRVDNQPTLVSIVDLAKLSEDHDQKPAQALQPIATFALPYGCSYLSFAPSGLSLLSASAKGDVQHVWDLMRMVHGKNGTISKSELNTPERGPTIRQIARFTRMTVASIVDIVWTEPRGERLAIVTDKGTVHIFDLPPSAFQWPPPRRLTRPATAPGQSSNANPNPQSNDAYSSKGTLAAAMNMVQDHTQPLFAAVRGRPSNISNAFAGLGNLNFTTGAGAKGGKVVAAGFSKSAGAATATVNSIRHMGENRLHIPGSAHSITSGCVRWLGGKDRAFIAVNGDGVVRIYNVRQSINAKAGKRRPSVVGGRPTEFPLPKIQNDVSQISGNDGSGISTVGGYWLPSTAPSHSQIPVKRSAHPLSFAEIETNAPYQPFHTDRRITLRVFGHESGPESSDPDPHHLHDSSSPWVFGEDIPSTKVNFGSTSSASISSRDRIVDQGGGELDMPARQAQVQMENLISREGNVEEGQQVVVTTRRKRGKKGDGRGGMGMGMGTRDMGQGHDEEFFFEDDCEVVDFAEDRV